MALGLAVILALTPAVKLADGKVTAEVLGDASEVRAGEAFRVFVIDKAGVLRYAGAIDSDPRGKDPAPTNLVDQAVSALLAGKDPPVASSQPYGCSVKYK